MRGRGKSPRYIAGKLASTVAGSSGKRAAGTGEVEEEAAVRTVARKIAA